MIPDSRMKDTEVFKLLFKDSRYIHVLTFEKTYLMTKVRIRLTSLMSFIYLMMDGSLEVKTKSGELDSDTYINRFTGNLFNCLKSCWKKCRGTFDADSDIRNRVYHGTSTKFLPEISKNGLLPSKAGQCWEEDKEQKPSKVCLTDSMYAAEFYAMYAAKEIGGEPIVLILNIRGIKGKMKIRFARFGDGHSTPFDI